MESYVRVCGIALLLILTLSSIADCQMCLMRGGCYKTHENANRQVDFHICGSDIYPTVVDVCHLRRKRDLHQELDIVMGKKESHQFLRRSKRRVYDIVEECCVEGCVVEEVKEYCDPTL